MVRRLFEMKKLFLLLVMAVLGVLGCRSLDFPLAKPHPVERVAIMSHTDITWDNSTRALALALKFYREEKVDRVVFIGDPTKNGYRDQQRVFKNLWEKSFAGTKPPKLEIVDESFRYGAVEFVAKGRLALTDLLCVYPFDSKRINVGSMRGIETSQYFMKYPNSAHAAARNAAQGVLVLKYEDFLEVRRIDFSGKIAEDVAPPWRVNAEGKVVSESKLRPQFWKDTKIAVLPGYDLLGNKVLTIRWPSVFSKYTGVRAFSYDLEIISDCGKNSLYHLQSRGFFLPESRDDKALSFSLPSDNLKSGKIFITPISSLGLRGSAIETSF